MDFVSPIVDVTCRLCGCIANTTNYIHHLQHNLNSLRIEKEKLIERRNDVKRQVESAERRQMHRTEQVDGWLRRVNQLEREVDQILLQGDEEIQRRCLKICPGSCLSRHKLGKKISKKLRVVAGLNSEGDFSTVAVTLAPPHAEEIPLDRIVGLDSNFDEVLRLVRDDDNGVGIIGIYGMAGVGKTTLLKKLNNELATRFSGEFDEVIWVVVSRDVSSVESVQDKIGKKLGFPGTWRSNKSQDEKKQDIFRFLRGKKFVLLLDDIWKQIDLLEVGVPVLSYKAKVIFTTRSEEVCGLMEAKKKIKAECLVWEQAWDLFKDKVGEETLNSDPEIRKLAQDVCKECSGLPLTLITIGRAMASKRTPHEWDYAVNVLKKSTFKFSGMGEQVFPLLKFSYDNLSDETTKICFLYCALYPEDWDIYVPDLIKLFIGEGFLDDECDNIDEACKMAYEIIGRLKCTCLLLESKESRSFVNMHDVIRDMAFWIVSENGRREMKYFVQGNLNLTKAPPISKWEKAERVFLLRNSIEDLNGTPRCPNLLTLNLSCSDHLSGFLSNSRLMTISDNFFQFMPVLKVLDLSGNEYLTKLPSSFFRLFSLQHLDLSLTGITELPIEFKSLVKLKYLYMNEMHKLDMIPPQVISSLSMLQRVEMKASGVSRGFDEGSIFYGGNELLLDELVSLNHLQYLSLSVKTELALQKLLSSQKLRSCTFGLGIEHCQGSRSLQLCSLQKNIKRLEFLEIKFCYDLELLSMSWDMIDGSRSFHNLGIIWITHCTALRDLTWLICAPNLRELGISCCCTMEQVIKDDDIGREGSLGVFVRLQKLFLDALPMLKSIYSHSLSFPSLIHIKVHDCPRLKKLPFDCNSGKDTLRTIQCQRGWWDKLEWENEETQYVFSPLFKEEWW
ncbi:disease resistance protein SUMM2-like isoform X1 [Cornus florida]|uniref:disease resistance protein SUMM2-like isoform X1 n=1 Tax=Cornus florida TaxID=4283 RepID=UPI00289D3F8B|nr:disease resistance protein SUMM2-like isoform X1 [Cornus florida]XP_059653109.1 disease resistance protein SUMM2-like isoform X1 [Cornus florida]XP_059653110.1 disease resistance protein SUMM2-like isoform X1 [Cornus florida]XP_059653112.1 disease resistance protein SUMM2-like isoform X1 [Cornus florida]